MKNTRVFFTAVVVCGLASSVVISAALAQHAPPVSLAQIYSVQSNLSRYWVSEKLDGARAWWDGKNLLSRNGNIFHAPDWFVDALPDEVLDGELWMGRGQFQSLMQTIRDTEPDEAAWRQVKYLVFDAPRVAGDFSQRQQVLSKIINQYRQPWFDLVEQRRVNNDDQLQAWLQAVVSGGGEGLILQLGNSAYYAGRHDGMLKLKSYQDSEARVLGFVPGKGKYKGLTGSLLVVEASGVQFKLGSGLTDEQRRNPPPIGAQVSFRFEGRTRSGKPRFARLLRLRPKE